MFNFYLRKNMSLVNAVEDTSTDDNFDDFLDVVVDNIDPKSGGSNKSSDDDDDLDDDNDDPGDDDLNQDDDDDDDDETNEDDNSSDDEDDDENEEEEDEDEDNEDDDVKSKSKLLLRLDALEKTNEKLLDIIKQKDNKNDEDDDSDDEDDTLENPLEGEIFKDLSEAMNWDEDDQKTMKSFFTMFAAYNQANTLSAAEQNIPNIVTSQMTMKQKKAAISKKFYDEHTALGEVKTYVSNVAANVAKEWKADGKALDLDKILSIAAKRSYKALNIKPNKRKQNNGKKPGSGKKPAFASNKGSRKGQKKESDTETMIGAIMDLDN